MAEGQRGRGRGAAPEGHKHMGRDRGIWVVAEGHSQSSRQMQTGRGRWTEAEGLRLMQRNRGQKQRGRVAEGQRGRGRYVEGQRQM